MDERKRAAKPANAISSRVVKMLLANPESSIVGSQAASNAGSQPTLSAAAGLAATNRQPAIAAPAMEM